MQHKKRVMVGLSGGVDSSVAASILLEQGFLVEGLFMKNWEEDDNDANCPAAKDLLDAQKVCEILNIPLHTVNFSNEYWETVFEHFLNEYRLGRTPNPDILCNREIKIKAFLNYALERGADYIATGHYANTHPTANYYDLSKAKDANKDQSYFLYTLSQIALSKTLFPIGNLEKPEVRSIAKKLGFPNFSKKDSTGICFIGERKFKAFLNRYLPAKPGAIETPDGFVIGQHDGLMFHTLGQRQGLKIGGLKDYENTPWYVVGKNLERNVLVVAQGKNHPLMYSTVLKANQLHWVRGIAPDKPLHCSAKIRYRQKETPCLVKQCEQDYCLVTFNEPERAVTPGQSVVFYQDNICLGGGIIN